MTMNRYFVRTLLCVVFLSTITMSTCFADDLCGACGSESGTSKLINGGLRSALADILSGLLDDEQPADSCGVLYCEACAIEAYSCGSECEGDVCSVEETRVAFPLDIEVFLSQESIDPVPAVDSVPAVEVSYGAWESHEYVKERQGRSRSQRNQNRSGREKPKDEETSTSAGSLDEVVEEEFLQFMLLETSMEQVEVEAPESAPINYGPREGFAYTFDPISSAPVEVIEPTFVKLEEAETSSSASSGGESFFFFWDFESTEQVDSPVEPDA
jgi:hypothetical protein